MKKCLILVLSIYGQQSRYSRQKSHDFWAHQCSAKGQEKLKIFKGMNFERNEGYNVAKTFISRLKNFWGIIMSLETLLLEGLIKRCNFWCWSAISAYGRKERRYEISLALVLFIDIQNELFVTRTFNKYDRFWQQMIKNLFFNDIHLHLKK